jgi:hypothetical protein
MASGEQSHNRQITKFFPPSSEKADNLNVVPLTQAVPLKFLTVQDLGIHLHRNPVRSDIQLTEQLGDRRARVRGPTFPIDLYLHASALLRLDVSI